MIHEVWGLSSRIQDICKQLGKLGFAACAPNLYCRDKALFAPSTIRLAMTSVWNLSLEDRYNSAKVKAELDRKGAPEAVTRLLAKLYDRSFRKRLIEDLAALAADASSKYGQVVAMGFSMGGGLCLQLAARSHELTSTVVFYGDAPESDQIAKISAPVLAIYAGRDDITNIKVPSFVQSMIEHRKDFAIRFYANAGHGFFNNARKNRYDEEATKNSWNLVKRFLNETLRK